MNKSLEQPIQTFKTGPLEIFVFLHYKDTQLKPDGSKQYSISFYFEITDYPNPFELDSVQLN